MAKKRTTISTEKEQLGKKLAAPSTVELTRLSEDRWEDYRELRLASLKSEPLAFASSYEDEKDLSEDEWKRRIKNTLFAVLNNRLVGMIVYVGNNKLKTIHVIDIFGVYVSREYRGQGVGKKLIEGVLTEVQKSRGIKKIKLTISPEQKAAVNLYQQYGFKTVGQCKKELYIEGRFYDLLMMEKYL